MWLLSARGLTLAAVMSLQRSAGNQAVARMMGGRRASPPGERVLQRYLFQVPQEGNRLLWYDEDSKSDEKYDPGKAPNLSPAGVGAVPPPPEGSGKKQATSPAETKPSASSVVKEGSPEAGQAEVKSASTRPEPGTKQPAYTSNETVPPEYPNHAKEHEQLIKLVQLLMDLLVRRADGAINSGRQAYMIGVMEHLQEGKEQAERIRNAAIAMSGAQAQGVTNAIEDLSGLIASLESYNPVAASLPPGPRGRLDAVANIRIESVKDFGVEDEVVRELVGAPPKPGAPEKPSSVPTPESSGPDQKSDQAKREVAKATLTNCAAKKLTLSMPPPKAGARMTEVFYDPNGNNAVRIPDKPGGTRYHHRQRVSSCEDCQVFLPKIHKAMTEHFTQVKEAVSSAPVETMPARETVPEGPPLKAEKDVAKPSFVPKVPGEVKPEKQSTAFAFEALSASVGKIGASDPAEQSKRLRDRATEVMRARNELFQHAKDETALIAAMLTTGKELERLALNTYVETDKVRMDRENALQAATEQLAQAESTLKDKRPKPQAKTGQAKRTLKGDVADPATFITQHPAWQQLPNGFDVTVPVSVPPTVGPDNKAKPTVDVNQRVTFALGKLNGEKEPPWTSQTLALASQVTSAITRIIEEMPWAEGDTSTIPLKFAKGSK